MYLQKKTAFCFLGILFSAFFMTVNAAEFKLKGITVSHPYLVVFGKSAKSGAGYFVISNKNSGPVILNKVTTDFGVAMMHKTDIDKKGIAKMKHLNSIIIPGNGSLKLEPGGVHLMFTSIETELIENTKYSVSLLFEEQGSLNIDLLLKSAKKNHKAHKHKNGDSHKHDN